MTNSETPRPSSWAIVLAFGLVYVSWGTTYLAIREGVHAQHLPPALFGGTRVCLAGLVLLAYLALRGEKISLPGREWIVVAISGMLLFVGGNGLITVAEKSVESGVASVLVATTPLWMALLELFWPSADRLSWRGWIGLLIGLCGVLILLAPKVEGPDNLWQDPGPFLVLGSSWCWSLGSLVVRYQRRSGSHLVAAAGQMIVGGLTLTLIGIAMGETRQLSPELSTPRAWFSFFYLLVVGSLVGFVAFNWLLAHVRASLVGTYAYVNPLIAVLVGWLLGGEALTISIVCGMFVILSGVALVRSSAGHQPKPVAAPVRIPRPASNLTGLWQNFTAIRRMAEEEPEKQS